MVIDDVAGLKTLLWNIDCRKIDHCYLPRSTLSLFKQRAEFGLANTILMEQSGGMYAWAVSLRLGRDTVLPYHGDGSSP